MVEIKTYNFNSERDNCNNRTVASLNINGTSIDLCQECMDNLYEELVKFRNTTFCHQCKYFEMSKYGSEYGGSCRLDCEDLHIELTENDFGHICCKDCMDTCDRAVRSKT